MSKKTMRARKPAAHRHRAVPPSDMDGPNTQAGSYSMVDPRFRDLYFRFYKETYKPSVLDRKTKELVAIAASLVAHCQGCLEGHIRKALKLGAAREEIGEVIAIAIGVSAASVVDLTDHAARRMDLKLY